MALWSLRWCCCTAALQVMEGTPHIFLSGPEVEQFAVQQGHTLVGNSSFTTEQRRQQWERQRQADGLPAADEIVQQHVRSGVEQQTAGQGGADTQHTQTVGAVAIDSAGRLAAATSTGGRTCKVRCSFDEQVSYRIGVELSCQGCCPGEERPLCLASLCSAPHDIMHLLGCTAHAHTPDHTPCIIHMALLTFWVPWLVLLPVLGCSLMGE